MFTAQHAGEYSFCFSNDMSTFAEKIVDFEITVPSTPLPHFGAGGVWQGLIWGRWNMNRKHSYLLKLPHRPIIPITSMKRSVNSRDNCPPFVPSPRPHSSPCWVGRG